MERSSNVPARAPSHRSGSDAWASGLRARARRVVPPAPRLGRKQRALIARLRGTLLDHDQEQTS